MSARTKSVRKPEQRPATHADVMAVLNSAAALIAQLELRVQQLEEKAQA